MIAQLRGKLTWSGTDQVIVDVGGVGYRVFVPSSTRARLGAPGREVLLHTSLQVREDSMTLYGFTEPEEYQLFEILLTVSGIGPKVAIGILSAVSAAGFRRAVLFDDVASLTKLPGIGKKTAQRLVLELKEKLGASEAEVAEAVAAGAEVLSGAGGDVFTEAMEYLVVLGYNRTEAGEALVKVRAGLGAGAAEQGVEDLVRQGLRVLAARG